MKQLARVAGRVICASAVLAAAVFYLQNILVRFVLALALRFLLTPLIDAIHRHCRVPRGAPTLRHRPPAADARRVVATLPASLL